MKLDELDTPALFVDIDIMMADIREMHAHLKKHHIKCRPHIKTHKVPALAHIQIREGAEGITCQKLGEAEVMVNAGIDDIFVAYNIIGKQKLERLSRLAKQAKIAVVADSEFVAKNLSIAMKTANSSLKVFVECDIAKLRSGVRTPVQAAQLAKKINDLPGIEYEGMMQFKGGYPDIEFVKQTGSFFEEAVDLLNKGGIETRTISSGGTVYAWTGWPKYSSHLKMVNECRPGAYIFYDRIKVAEGITSLEKCSSRILATVISKPTNSRAILDAGSKSFGVRRHYRGGEDLGSYGHIINCPDAVLSSLFEEHGIVDNCPSRIKIGDKLTIIPNYIMDNINIHDTLYGIRKDTVEVIWPISARGRSQ